MSKFNTYFPWFGLTFVHTWLFFEQSLGFNAVIFSIIFVSLITLHHELQHEKMWWYGVCGHFIAAIAVAWHGTDEAAMAYYFSSFLLAGLVFSVRSSLPVALLNGIAGSFMVALAASIPVLIADSKQKLSAMPFMSGAARKRAYLYVAPLSVTVVFYLLYCVANPDFFIEIRLPEWELNVKLVFYVIFGLIVLCPFFFSWGFRNLVDWDAAQPNLLKRFRLDKRGTVIGLIHENRQGVIMFVMLNLLIALFLLFNFLQIFIPSLSHVQSSHSEQVHQGFGTLIVSILVAIVLIMYYFRGNQNFYSRNRPLILLATIWIVLNAVLAIFTCYKNVLYVDAFGLTYKRIWVFIGMMLTVIGLCFTLFKINHLRTNWYLIRQNTWVLYFMLASYTGVDWDRIITWYNSNYAQEFDIEYILGLGNTKLPYLKEMQQKDDPRSKPYQERISMMVSNTYPPPHSWKEETLDNLWLKAKLGK